MKKFQTILFDFDGTVMDTSHVVLNSWQHTFRTLEGKEHPAEEIYKTFGEPLEVTMGKKFPGTDAKKAIEIYRSYHKDHFELMIEVCEGIPALLTELKKRGYRMALVTSRMKETTLEGLEAHRLSAYFDALVTCDDTSKHKPDPEPILVALRKLNADPDTAIMIGDTFFDIGCARNAGVSSVLVGWSVALSKEEQETAGADFWIEHPMDLLDILE